MPIIPRRPWYARAAVIAAVGAVAISIANLACYLAGASPEVYAMVSAIVAAGLALWRAAGGVPPAAPPTMIVLLVAAALGGGCASTMRPVQRDGVARLVRAAVEGTAGTLEIYELGEAADLVRDAEDGVVRIVEGSIQYPADTAAVARGVVEAVVPILVELHQDTAARLVAVLEPVIHWIIDRALGAVADPPAPSASGSSE